MTDKTLTFYTHPMSRGRIARWMLEETGADYETELLEYGGTMKHEDYLAINPMGKVPCIRHGDTVVTESAAICAYLADAFLDAQLAPPLHERGEYYRWLFFAAGPIEMATSLKALDVDMSANEPMMGHGTIENTVSTFTDWLKNHDYVTGKQFTAADVYLSSHIGWGFQIGTLETNEVLQAYVDRTQSRPAHVRATAIDDELIANAAQ